jgi:hypothetical protein
MIIEPKNIDYKKFKRVFAFGCSFTRDKWPTWADILRQELLHTEFYNFGRSGAGNLMTSCRIVEASKHFKFNEEDLVLIMWSTFCREDRWAKGNWIHPGNIFTQDTYDNEFVKKFADPNGYLIRDAAIIDMSLTYLETLSATAIALPSVPITHQMDLEDSTFKKIKETYDPVFNRMPLSMVDLELNGVWEYGHEYYSDHYKNIFKDYHPSPLRYFRYLEKVGFPLSNSTGIYAQKSTEDLHATKTENEIIDLFLELKSYDSHHRLF